MNVPDRFDPFNNRHCRDVRNVLSENFKICIRTKNLTPVRYITAELMADSLPDHILAYLQHRFSAYEKIMADITAQNFEKPVDIAISIWKHHLFFETHEYLETYWLTARGQEKRFLQALIRAAGTYVHLEQGNLIAARRMSRKAIAGLIETQALLLPHADVQTLIEKLTVLDPDPPFSR